MSSNGLNPQQTRKTHGSKVKLPQINTTSTASNLSKLPPPSTTFQQPSKLQSTTLQTSSNHPKLPQTSSAPPVNHHNLAQAHSSLTRKSQTLHPPPQQARQKSKMPPKKTKSEPKSTQSKPKPKPPRCQPNQPVKISTPDPDTHGIPLDPLLAALGNEITPQNKEEDVVSTWTKVQLTSGENNNQQQFNLHAPPNGTYKVSTDMHKSVQNFAANHGYVIVTRRKNKKFFQCKQGSSSSPNCHQANKNSDSSPSGLANYPSSAAAKFYKESECWVLSCIKPFHHPLANTFKTPNPRLPYKILQEINQSANNVSKPLQNLNVPKIHHPEHNVLSNQTYAPRQTGKFQIRQALQKCGPPRLEDTSSQKKRNTQEMDPFLSALLPPPSFPDFELSSAPFLIASLPSSIKQCVKRILNVGGDGHCGFRAASYCLGRSQNDWFNI
ncbi:hypothetical protein PGT21_010305 [Puccinia graminis f. sp. tritici]|uniref:OTU domain-containing protein n=1 Tax=Puccinia graminis f. sp. tritici TaxID=56615 RepID=A0A5B0MNK8_PUCGR|nr:hypothetical protein PGT21_010305 [Puccinia graminis f. sp. tritici]